MQDPLQKAIELQEVARSFRKKGDSLRKAGRETSALEAFESGLSALNEARELLKAQDETFHSLGPPLANNAAPALRELVEIYGALGGMHQRLGWLDKAFSSYESGAGLEEKFGLPSTYNRLNALKYSLLTGRDRLGTLEERIQILADVIEGKLRADKGLGDSGWAWADLGDCLALLGRATEAGKAYATFIAKAEIKSPERTLDVLKEISSKLGSAGDPDAPRLVEAISALQAKLVAR